MKKKSLLLTMVLVLSFLLSACGSSDKGMPEIFNGIGSDSAAMDSGWGSGSYETDGKNAQPENELSEAMPESPESPGEMGTGADGMLTGDKLVYNCDLTIETLDYAGCVQSIKDHILAYQGIIQSESENDDAYGWYYDDYVKTSGTRYLSMTVRIPSQKYYEFLSALEGTGKIVSKNSYVENISRQYYETDAYIKSLEIQQERLLDMMEQATTIEDMITIEARLSEVQYQLSMAKNQLSAMDADVEYSTVTVSVREVMEYTPQEPAKKSNTFWNRLQNTLVETWEMFLEMLEFLLFAIIRLIPVLFILAVIVGIVLGIIKMCSKRNKKKALKSQNVTEQK